MVYVVYAEAYAQSRSLVQRSLSVCVCARVRSVSRSVLRHITFLLYSEQVDKVMTKISNSIKLSYYMSFGQSVA